MYQEDGFVCANCFVDPGLIRFIREHAVAMECSFCSTTDSVQIAAPIAEVSEHFTTCLFHEYDLAANQLGWIDGGWVGNYWDAEDLALYEIELDFPQGNQDVLLPHLFGEDADQDWCEKNAYGLNDQQQAQLSWKHFRDRVMHHRRFFFMDDSGDPYESDVYSPREVLRTIFENAQQMELFKEIPPETQLFRARYEGSTPRLKTAQELGPSPFEKATQSNRMSPAGIPMFYACADDDTALQEVQTGPGCFAIGQFETLRPATVLDLTEIPPVPSLFETLPDSIEFWPRRILTFLHHIARQVSQPIERGDKVHIDYVPTQVVTEFIRTQLTWRESFIDGIKYSSSVRPGHVSYVLFANQDNLLLTQSGHSSGDPWLKLTNVKHRYVSR